jgi:hypothetical protein
MSVNDAIYGAATTGFFFNGFIHLLLAVSYIRGYLKNKGTWPIFWLSAVWASSTVMLLSCAILYSFRVFNAPFEIVVVLCNTLVAIASLGLLRVTVSNC